MPEEGTAYEPGIASLEACAIYGDFRDRAYGGMPIQLGMCRGHMHDQSRDQCMISHVISA